MGAGQAQAVADALIAAGAPRSLPVLVVENASLPDSRRVACLLEDLPRISQYGLTGPAVIMLGRVFADAVSSTEHLPVSASKSA
jgi:siroheme synthase